MLSNVTMYAFLFKSKVREDGKAPVYVKIKISGVERRVSTAQFVAIKSWDNKFKLANPKSENARCINDAINTTLDNLNAIANSLYEKEGALSADNVVALYNDQQEKISLAPVEIATRPLMEYFVDDTIKQLTEAVLENRKCQKSPNPLFRERKSIEFKNKCEIINLSILEFEKKCFSYFDDSRIEKTFFDSFNHFVLNFCKQVIQDERSYETIRKWVSTKRKIASYFQYRYQKADFALKEIDSKHCTELFQFLSTGPTSSCQSNTSMKYIKNLKQVIEYAITHRWLHHNPVEKFTCTYKRPKRQPVNISMLVKILNFRFTGTDNFNATTLGIVRDIFLVACLTGFAYQELYALEDIDIIIGIDGNKWLSRDRIKNDNLEAVPLLPITETIINKYKDHPCRMLKNKLLPVYSNKYLNEALKELAIQCGISMDLFSHIGRHTFATTILADMGMSTRHIAQFLGQKDERSAKHYTENSRAGALREFNTKVRDTIFIDDTTLTMPVF